MDSQTYRLGFIGAGKLAGAVIRGLVRAQFCAAAEIVASEPNEQTRTALKREVDLTFTTSNAEVAEKADLICLAVKPAIVLPALREISQIIEDKLVVSLAAGVRLNAMEAAANARFMRALTNTPSAVCRAATAIAPGSRSNERDLERVRAVFSVIGVVVEISEEHIDAVTALSGSGPAFVYSVIEWLARGGEEVGLPAPTALTLAIQTVLGAAKLAQESKLSPEELRRQVVTPGGTTAAGLAAMEQMRTADGLIAAVEAATKRGQEMARENL